MQHAGMVMAKAPGVKVDLHDDAAAKTLTMRLGPLNLPAHTSHHMAAQAPDLFFAVPFDGWFMAYHPRIVDAGGSQLPNKLLHHVAVYNTARSDFLCPKKEEHIFGAGGEMNDWPALPGYGYRVAKGDRIRVSTMFHNPTDTSYPETYIEVRIEYRRLDFDKAQLAALTNVYPAWFDVKECGNSAYDLKPGENVTTGAFTLRYDGRLLGVGGHMHDYGRRLVLENVTRKETLATLDSTLDPQGRILSMPIKTFLTPPAPHKNAGKAEPDGYRLDRREVVRVTATYDNTTGQNLPEGAMGIVVGYFVPNDDSQFAHLRRK
jgi:hypothetical protein